MFCLGHLSFGFHSEQEAIKAYSIYSHTPPQSDTHTQSAILFMPVFESTNFMPDSTGPGLLAEVCGRRRRENT